MHRHPAISILSVVAVWCCWHNDTNAQSQPPTRSRVDALVKPYMDNEIVQGMSIGILHDGKPEFFGYGKADRQRKEVPNEKTIYEIGSITKVFTGLLLADAVTQGLVTLKQSAVDLLPSGNKLPTHPQKPITVKHLATHTSGLPRRPDNMKFSNPNNPYADYTADQLYEFLNSYQLPRAPGKKSAYSNLGMGLLGQLLASQQTKSYEQLFHDRISGPLKLTDTTISLDNGQSSRLASPFRGDGSAAANWDIPTLAGAGAIRSTASDMLKFAEFNLNPPVGKIGQAIELAWKVHQQPLDDDDFAMGLAWHVARDGSTRWHNGQTGGYHSMLMVNRKLGSAVVVLANTASGEVDQLAGQLIQLTAGADPQPRQFEKTIDVPPEVLQRYVGTYELIPNFVFTVTTKNDKLFVELTGQPSFQVYPKSETQWFYKVVKAEITFEVDDAGKCKSLELFQNGVRQTAKRIKK